MRFNSRPLINAVKAAIRLPAYAEGEGSQRTWLRPPLVTDKVLGGVRLQDYVKVTPQCKYDPDELIDIAERYIDRFILGHQDHYDESTTPCAWIRANVALTKEADRWLFPGKVVIAIRDDVWRHLATLLWLLSNCAGTLRLGPGLLVLEAGGYSTGVENGRIVSRIPSLRVEAPHDVDFEAYLKNSPSGWSSQSRLLAWNRVLRQASHEPNSEALIEALLILHSRIANKQLLLKTLYPKGAERKKRKDPMTKVYRMADSLISDPAPYTRLKKFLVPHWMPTQTFNILIKKPITGHQPSLLTVAAWKDTVYDYFGLSAYKADVRADAKVKQPTHRGD